MMNPDYDRKHGQNANDAQGDLINKQINIWLSFGYINKN